MTSYNGLSNPYPVANPIATGLATAQQVIGLRGALQDQRDRTEDREARRGLMGLQTRQAELGVQKMEREEDRAKQVAEWKRQATVGRARLRAADQHFDGLVEFAEGIQNGDAAIVKQAWPNVVAAYNDIHYDDINKGNGEERPDGSKIVGKQVADFRVTKDGRYVPVLTVTVEDKDGKRSTYEAPATVGRNSDPNAELMTKTDEDLLNDLQFALEAGLMARSGEGLKQYDEMLRQKGLALEIPPDEVDKILGVPKPTGTTRNVTKNGKPVVQERMSDGSWVDQEGVEPYRDPAAATPEEARRLRAAQLSAAERTARGGDESWGTPVAEFDENGKPINVRYGSRGGRQIVQGSTPTKTADKVDVQYEDVYGPGLDAFGNPTQNAKIGKRPAWVEVTGADGKVKVIPYAEYERQNRPPPADFPARDGDSYSGAGLSGLPGMRTIKDKPAPAPTLPASARSRLKEGVSTKFGNGQTWTLRDGQPVQVK